MVLSIVAQFSNVLGSSNTAELVVEATFRQQQTEWLTNLSDRIVVTFTLMCSLLKQIYDKSWILKIGSWNPICL